MLNKATSCSNLEYYIWLLYMSFGSCCSFQFFGFMSMLYLACAIGWLIASCCYWKDLLRVQVCCLFRSHNFLQLYCTIFHCTSNFTVAEMAKLDGRAKVFSLQKGRITKHIVYVHRKKKWAFFGLFKTMAERHMIQIAQNKLVVLLCFLLLTSLFPGNTRKQWNIPYSSQCVTLFLSRQFMESSTKISVFC